jgi:hypothetical protein
MLFDDNIDRSPYRSDSTCDWRKKSMQNIEDFQCETKKNDE